MYREFFAHSPLLALPLLSLLIFVTVFSLILLRTLRSAPEASVASLPLDEEVRS